MTELAGSRRLSPQPALAALRRGVAAVERIRPLYVVGAFIVAEWLVTLSLALKIRHKSWLWYQGGDQVWFYTTSWLLRHGQIPPTYVGYGWSVLLMPFTLFGGPNLINVLPAIILLNVLVLMPVAMTAMYGIGQRLGGRLFGYWVLTLWIVLPLIGILYTDTGFKQRYTELALPDSFGLTALSDFPSMVMLVVAGYFLLRVLQRPDLTDGLLAGLFAGFAIGIKPSTSLFLFGVVLAVIGSRRWRVVPAVALGLAPCILALSFWKWRGLGYLPLFHSEPTVRLAVGARAAPLGLTLSLHKYLTLDWGQFGNNLSSLREHFWSARVVEWTVIAGVVALARASRTAFLLIGGWFAAIVIVKGTGQFGDLETGGLLHMLVPAIPPFVLMVACIPLLVPGSPRRLLRVQPPRAWATGRMRVTLVTAAVIVFAAVPVALAGASSHSTASFGYTPSGPIPVKRTFQLHAQRSGRRVTVSWSPQHASGGPLFYEVRRSKPSPCTGHPADYACVPIVALTRSPSYTETVPRGTWIYIVLAGGNWLDDGRYGDEYLATEPVTVTIP